MGGIDQATLNSIFEGMGQTVVRSRVIPDSKGTGSSVAMVQLASVDQATAAIAALNGSMLALPQASVAGGTCLTVKYAGDGNTPSDNLYLTGLPGEGVDQAALQQIFEGLGLTVMRSRLIPDTRGSGTAAAMVQLASQEEAATAISSLNGQVLQVMESPGSA